LLATQLGAAAFDHVARRQYGVLVGIIGGKLASTPLRTVITNKKEVDSELITLARVLAI
jgi:6-phosphofructokinase